MSDDTERLELSPEDQQALEDGRRYQERRHRQDIRRRAAQKALAEKIEAEGEDFDLEAYVEGWEGNDNGTVDDDGDGRDDRGGNKLDDDERDPQDRRKRKTTDD